MAPDLDAIGWLFDGHGTLPPGHRGTTHSLLVALAAATLATLWCRSRSPLGSITRTFAYFALVIASHGLLDCLTRYGTGVELLAPFSSDRFTATWHPFGMTPEFLFLWLPALLVLQFDIGGFRRSQSDGRQESPVSRLAD